MMLRSVVCVLFSMNILYGACTFGPSGINQWELLYQVANCVNQCSGSSGGNCSSLDSAIDELGSKIEACCLSLSFFDRLILSDVDNVSSKIDVLSSESDACCASLSALEVINKSAIDSVGSQVSQVKSVVDNISGKVDSVSRLEVINKTSIDSVGSQVAQLGSRSDACCASLSTLDRLIFSNIDSVSSKIDVLSSKSDVCCSFLDSEIRSVSDVMVTEINQVEVIAQEIDTCLVGIAITQKNIPYTIEKSGLYTLCEDITYGEGAPAITINANNVVLDLQGHHIEHSASAIAVSIEGNNIKVCNGSVTANDGIALFMSKSSLVTIFDVTVPLSASEAVRIANSNYVSVINCASISHTIFDTNSFSVEGTSDGLLFSGCKAYDVRLSGFSLQSVPSTNVGFIVQDCYADGPNGSAQSVGFSSRAATSAPTSLKKCAASDLQIGIFFSERNNVLIEHCSTLNTQLYGMFISSGVAVQVIDSTVENSLGYGYYLDTISDLVMKDCISDTQRGSNDGFAFVSCSVVTAQGCMSEGYVEGFNVLNVTEFIFDSCTAKKTGDNGFILSSDVLVKNCVAAYNQNNGFLISRSSDVTIEHSSAFNNQQAGFSIESSNQISLLSCDATSNKIGFNIDSGSNFITLDQCIASWNASSGINNANPFPLVYIMDTRSSGPAVGSNPAYQLNAGADSFGGAVIVTY